MKQRIRIWSQIPRKARICIFLGLSLLLGFFLYWFLGFPAFSPEQQFRRAEKGALVGPSTILGTVDSIDSTKVLLAETEQGILFFTYDPKKLSDSTLVYQEKTGDVTLLPIPAPQWNRNQALPQLPVILFDEHPDACRAEAEILIDAPPWSPYFRRCFQLEAQRTEAGYFHFVMRNDGGAVLLKDPLAQFAKLIYEYRFPEYENVSVPATVRLYDQDGNLICTRELRIGSPGTQTNLSQ